MAFRSAGLTINQFVTEITEADAATIVSKGDKDIFAGGTLDAYTSGDYFGFPRYDSLGGGYWALQSKPTSNVAGEFTAILCPVVKRTRFDQLAIPEGPNTVGAFRFGIYRDDGNLMGTGASLIDQLITGLNTAGNKLRTSAIDLTLSPGLYWWASLIVTALSGVTAGFGTIPSQLSGRRRAFRSDENDTNLNKSGQLFRRISGVATGSMPSWPAGATLPWETNENFIIPLLRVAAIGASA